MAYSAGCNEALIFQHFASKEKLYQAAMAATVDKGDEALRKVLENAVLRGDDLSILVSLARDLLRLHQTDRTLLPLLLFGLLEGD